MPQAANTRGGSTTFWFGTTHLYSIKRAAISRSVSRVDSGATWSPVSAPLEDLQHWEPSRTSHSANRLNPGHQVRRGGGGVFGSDYPGPCIIAVKSWRSFIDDSYHQP